MRINVLNKKVLNLKVPNIKVMLVVFFLSNISISIAGNQKEEALKEETRTLMSRSISDTAPLFKTFSSQKEEYDWLVTLSNQIKRQIPDEDERLEFLSTVHYEASRAGLDPLLVLGLISIESNFQKYAISSADARGYMQVMPFWVNVIGDKSNNLFHLRTNLRYGCTILKHYLDLEKGNIFMALGRYNGSRGQEKYPNLVLNAMLKFKGKIK